MAIERWVKILFVNCCHSEVKETYKHKGVSTLLTDNFDLKCKKT